MTPDELAAEIHRKNCIEGTRDDACIAINDMRESLAALEMECASLLARLETAWEQRDAEKERHESWANIAKDWKDRAAELQAEVGRVRYEMGDALTELGAAVEDQLAWLKQLRVAAQDPPMEVWLMKAIDERVADLRKAYPR